MIKNATGEIFFFVKSIIKFYAKKTAVFVKTQKLRIVFFYSTVTDFARFLGWSTSLPRNSAI